MTVVPALGMLAPPDPPELVDQLAAVVPVIIRANPISCTYNGNWADAREKGSWVLLINIFSINPGETAVGAHDANFIDGASPKFSSTIAYRNTCSSISALSKCASAKTGAIMDEMRITCSDNHIKMCGRVYLV